MTTRIIDNKKIDLTDDEFKVFQQICEAYDRPEDNFDGERLFQDLFETDEFGRIIFLKPPVTYTSMEVFMFLVAVMTHQHLGQACGETYKAIQECKKVTEECRKLMKEIKR